MKPNYWYYLLGAGVLLYLYMAQTGSNPLNAIKNGSSDTQVTPTGGGPVTLLAGNAVGGGVVPGINGAGAATVDNYATAVGPIFNHALML